MPKKKFLEGVKSPFRPLDTGKTVASVNRGHEPWQRKRDEVGATMREDESRADEDSLEVRHYRRNLKPMIQTQTGYMMEGGKTEREVTPAMAPLRAPKRQRQSGEQFTSTEEGHDPWDAVKQGAKSIADVLKATKR
jgi:hypothetical protein